MTTPPDKPETKNATDAPTRVFEGFLDALSKNRIPEDTVARLRKTLITDKKFSDKALKDAIFNPEQTA